MFASGSVLIHIISQEHINNAKDFIKCWHVTVGPLAPSENYFPLSNLICGPLNTKRIWEIKTFYLEICKHNLESGAQKLCSYVFISVVMLNCTPNIFQGWGMSPLRNNSYHFQIALIFKRNVRNANLRVAVFLATSLLFLQNNGKFGISCVVSLKQQCFGN